MVGKLTSWIHCWVEIGKSPENSTPQHGYPKWWFENGDSFLRWPCFISMSNFWSVVMGLLVDVPAFTTCQQNHDGWTLDIFLWGSGGFEALAIMVVLSLFKFWTSQSLKNFNTDCRVYTALVSYTFFNRTSINSWPIRWPLYTFMRAHESSPCTSLRCKVSYLRCPRDPNVCAPRWGASEPNSWTTAGNGWRVLIR